MRKIDVSAPVSERSYIESQIGPKFSCSFVEFDGRGDFIDFRQHEACWKKIEEIAKAEPILLVTYCHGWKNNSQSSDVVRFNDFLRRLADSVEGRKYRVHGVYLGWRGNPVLPFVEQNETFVSTREVFGESIVSPNWQRKSKIAGWLPENLSYWTRKSAAENKVSGIPLTRAVFTYAGMAKHHGGEQARSFVIGHSFGALMLEQSLLQGIVGGIMTDWSQNPISTDPLDLPFDLVLLVNSAAPSIHAKQTKEFLAAEGGRRRKTGASDADAPIIISVTSSGDGATKDMHRAGNLFAGFSPSMNRYYNDNLVKSGEGEKTLPVHQSFFYRRTPGHNPLMVERWIREEEATSMVSDELAFEENLNFNDKTPKTFYVRSGNGTAKEWRITRKPPEGYEGSFQGRTPSPWQSPYWIVECDPEIIKNHGDVWSPKAMDTYAALYRLAVTSRRE